MFLELLILLLFLPVLSLLAKWFNLFLDNPFEDQTTIFLKDGKFIYNKISDTLSLNYKHNEVKVKQEELNKSFDRFNIKTQSLKNT